MGFMHALFPSWHCMAQQWSSNPKIVSLSPTLSHWIFFSSLDLQRSNLLYLFNMFDQVIILQGEIRYMSLLQLKGLNEGAFAMNSN